MSGMSTHVLDTARGRPAAGVEVELARREDGTWTVLARHTTDADGRVAALLPAGHALTPGDYRLRFAVDRWFAAEAIEGFYPQVTIEVTVRDAAQHHHVPLLLAPYGYSTYRGS